MNSQKRGFIHFITGPMFAGKTTELIGSYQRYQKAGEICAMLKSVKDFRYSEENVTTHDGEFIPAVRTLDIKDQFGYLKPCRVVCIDEAHFYSDLADSCDYLANVGKIVIVSGLIQATGRKPFENVMELIPKCEIITKLSAVCIDCKGVADFTNRKDYTNPTQFVGGGETYEAVCRQCYFIKNPEELKQSLK